MFPSACIHGRFQILHNDHLAYFRNAATKHDRLYIGITGQQRDLLGTAGREARSENPLTYWERLEMWRVVLAQEGGEHIVGPFPIEAHQTLHDFVPTSCVCVTTIREAWNQEKVERLQAMGYKVDVLASDPNKAISGSQLRALIKSGDTEWKQKVPAAVADFLETINITARLRG